MKSFCEDWEEIHKSQEWGKYPTEQVIRFIARNYYSKERNKIKILDFGCGGGAHTWYLAREGFEVYAFDGSESAVKEAENYLYKEGFRDVKFEVADALDIGYENDFFDCVIDSVCIYANRIQDIREMYSKIYDILKKGGKLYTSSFGTKTDGYMTGECLEPDTFKNISVGVLSGRGIASFFHKEELLDILQTIGFTNIVIDTMFYTDNGVAVEMFFVQCEK